MLKENGTGLPRFEPLYEAVYTPLGGGGWLKDCILNNLLEADSLQGEKIQCWYNLKGMWDKIFWTFGP